MSQVIIAVIVTGVIVAAITWVVANQHRQKTYEAKIGSAEERSREIIDEALKIAETKKREALLEAKEESLKTKNELEKETKERRAELQRYERRVLSKEENLDKKAEAMEKREAGMNVKEEALKRKTAEAEALYEKGMLELEKISGLTSEQAKEYLLRSVEEDVKHDTAKLIKDLEQEGTHVELGVALCKKYKESATVINAVEAHHGDVEPQSLIACLVQAADTISAARPGARRETLETYTNRLKQLEDITNSYKGVDKSYAIQAGREVRIMVVPEQVSDDDMVLMAREISKRIQEELQYPGQIKVNVIRESRVTEYAK